MKPTLACSHEQWHALLVALDETRVSSRTVRVDKAALAALLKDHSQLLAYHKGEVGGVT